MFRRDSDDRDRRCSVRLGVADQVLDHGLKLRGMALNHPHAHLECDIWVALLGIEHPFREGQGNAVAALFGPRQNQQPLHQVLHAHQLGFGVLEEALTLGGRHLVVVGQELDSSPKCRQRRLELMTHVGRKLGDVAEPSLKTIGHGLDRTREVRNIGHMRGTR